MKANQASQPMPKLGKDNVSKKPLDAAKKKWSLWSLFIFNTKFSHLVTQFYLGYTFDAVIHARKILLVWLTIIIKIDLEADIIKSILRRNKGRILIESSTSKATSCFFWDIFLSDTRHVPAWIVLQLSVHLFAPFFGPKRYRDNVVCHVAHGDEYCFSDVCMGHVFG